uniref:G_PROTEIN_RECEP_F1_2 domain-containing protein n=1 Tax=Panagrellus redivivus TaxID=6233 RepID=A0A7E4UYK0_PANRE
MADDSNNSTDTAATNPVHTCHQWELLFSKLNHYFRDENVLDGSEHSSNFIGNLIIVAYAVVIILGAVGNLLTIVAIVRNAQMRTVRNFFILNLALSDFFICTVTAPITLYTVLYMFWPFGTTICKIAGSLQGFNIFLSTFSIAAIALDRYVLIIFPMKRQRQHNLSLLFFSLIWLISFVLALPLFTASDINLIFEKPDCGIQLTICHEQNQRWKEMPINKETYTVGVMVTQYAIPLTSIVFAYSRIAVRMRTRLAARNSLCNAVQNSTVNQRRKSVVERQRRTHLLLICIVVVFAIAWLPLNVFHVVNTFGWSEKFSVPTFALCHVLAITSACLNPMSYAFFNQNFRQEFAVMFEETKLLWVWAKIRDFVNRWRPSKSTHQCNSTKVTCRDIDSDQNGNRQVLLPTEANSQVPMKENAVVIINSV